MFFNSTKTRKNIKFGIKSSVKLVERKNIDKETKIDIIKDDVRCDNLIFYFYNPSLECFYDLMITKAINSKIYFINSSFK